MLIIFIITVAAGRILMFQLQRKKYARKFRAERTSSEKVFQQTFRQFLNIFWDFWIQNCGQEGNLFNRQIKIIWIKYNRIMMLMMLFNCYSNINTFSASSIIICTNRTLFLAFFPIFWLHFSGFFDLFLPTLEFVCWDILTTTVINFW